MCIIKTILMKKLLISITILIISSFSFAQLVVIDTTTQENMVKALEGPGVKFSNIVVDCPGSGSYK